MAVGERCAYQKRTTSGVIGTSGNAVIVFGVSLLSGGGGAGVLSLYDGTSTGGVLARAITGTTNDWFNQEFSVGKVFPSGLYLNLDTNTTAAVVWFQNIP